MHATAIITAYDLHDAIMRGPKGERYCPRIEYRRRDGSINPAQTAILYGCARNTSKGAIAAGVREVRACSPGFGIETA